MAVLTYEFLKAVANTSPLPCCIMSVEKKADGSCGDVRFFAINEIFKKNYYEVFKDNDPDNPIDYDSFDEEFEGKMYTVHLPKEPNYEDICFRAAWNGEYINTYVDTTRLYGFWTQNIIIPVSGDSGDPNISYCQFMYTLSKKMDTGKFSNLSPEVTDFVIKLCLELRNEQNFDSNICDILEHIREYTASYSAAIITVNDELKEFKVLGEAVQNDNLYVKSLFSSFPYSIFESWAMLLKDTDNLFIKDENDLKYYEEKAPEWVKTLRDSNVETLCLVPFNHEGEIIGYLYIKNFKPDNLIILKDTIELIAVLLTSEIANHTFLDRLEYLSTVDSLTGVLNRNAMNTLVDELALKMEFCPEPYCVAHISVNGLKSFNDEKGHDEGDRLLMFAASILKEIFTGDKIYRSCGDEFAIISFDNGAVFKQKIASLREKASDPDSLHLAIGYCCDETDGKIYRSLRTSYEAKQIEKDIYHDEHPEKRR